MVAWSKLLLPAINSIQKQSLLKNPAKRIVLLNQIRRMAGDHDHHYHLEPQISRFQWRKFKDLLHFYIFLGLIPVFGLIMFCNIFIGPAQLEPVPENYEPKHWEYYKHPISRFLARYLYPSPQENYEKYLHSIYEENEKAQIRKLEAKIRHIMSERHDYKAYYYRPALGKYLRVSKEAADALKEIHGDNCDD